MLTKELADALCTVIATGFIYENQTKSSGLKTKFIYELEAAKENETPEERYKREDKNKAIIESHEYISSRLVPYGINVTFAEQTPKAINPLIAAKTKYIFGEEQTQGLADECMRACQILETKLNRIKDSKLPGAYIGGLMKQNSFEFSGPSYLYLYAPQYREAGDEISHSYNNAKIASEKLVKFIRDNKGLVTTTDWRVSFVNVPPAIEDYKKDSLFASCHGMIMAMFQYQRPPKNDVWVELALGEDTSKIAACVPCSLFMYANASPASATHLGRGDNWNFPKNVTSDMQSKWRIKIKTFYETGIERMGKPPIAIPKVKKLLDWQEKNHITNAIPDIFLEALTFESPFTEKILSTLR